MYLNGLHAAVRIRDHQLQELSRGHLGDAGGQAYVDDFVTGQPQALMAVAILKHQGQHAHADEVGAMNTLEALDNDRFDAKQACTFGGPVATGAGTVFLAGEHHQGRLFALVAHGRIVNAEFVARWNVHGIATFHTLNHLVADSDIGERAAHHHLVIAAPRAVGVEIDDVDAVLLQVLTCRAVSLDGAGR